MSDDSVLVTVLMPVYNGARYLRDAIDSILGQTFRDFEFLIINDGSTDSSEEIIKSYKDHRITLVNNGRNLGLIDTLNKGLVLAQGEYVARMDCDDVSLPQRLERQITFMDRHPEIGVCGSWVLFFSNRREGIWRTPTSSEEIRCALFSGTAIAHPAAVLRKEFFIRNRLFYDISFLHAEDYELWANAINHFSFSNYPEVLLHYRKTPQQVSSIHNEIQMINTNRVREKQLNLLGLYPNEEENLIHKTMLSVTSQKSFSISDLKRVEKWLLKIRVANNEKGIYDEALFSNQLASIWFYSCYYSARVGKFTWNVCRESSLYENAKIDYAEKIKFAIKCIVKIW